jgi:hypothetical protein
LNSERKWENTLKEESKEREYIILRNWILPSPPANTARMSMHHPSVFLNLSSLCMAGGDLPMIVVVGHGILFILILRAENA